MLIEKATKIPGVQNNDEFSNWLLKDNGIRVHLGLTIGSSKLGGIGLFFNQQKDVGTKDDIELARIPKDSTFDYMSLLQVLEGLKDSERKQETDEEEITESGIISAVLKSIQPSNETEILTCYFIGIKICYNRRLLNEMQTKSPLSKFDPYLNVLAHTEILGLRQEDADYDDTFVQKLSTNADRLYEEFSELISDLEHVHPSITFEEYYQLCGAIKSRVLEIPHSSEDEDEDYYTNITLIPLLDFANHSNTSRSHAYFDVDKLSGDVLLKLNRLRMQQGLFEVTISYSTTECIQKFIQTYGFIPQSNDTQLFEYRISQDICNHHINEIMKESGEPYDKIMKWLRILPQFQLVKTSDDIFVNFFSNSLPLIFIDGLKYDNKWTENAYNSFKEFNEIEISKDEFAQSVLPILKVQESDYDFINAIGQIGVICNEKYPTQDTILQVSNNDSEEAFQLLISRCTAFIVKVAQSALDAKPPSSSSPSSFSQMTTDYYNMQLNFFRALIEKYEMTKDLSLPVELAKDEWETDYRSAPRQITLN
mmetsp:Transcript_5754/g.6890  ORF Transcript_5754/g.6890 Transcript_5754/m.6890 type:complete len:537 (+) Transcript_5754:1250-2860(+)